MIEGEASKWRAESRAEEAKQGALGTTTIFAGSVAHNQIGNERGVRVVKRSGLFTRDLKLAWTLSVSKIHGVGM